MPRSAFCAHRRHVALIVASSLLLVACGQAPSPASIATTSTQGLDATASDAGPATALKILGTAKFKDGGVGLHYIAVRGGKEIKRTLEFRPDSKGSWKPTLNGHVITKQYFQGREGRMLMAELQVIAKVDPKQARTPKKSEMSAQALPAIVIGATVVYVADLMVRATLVAVCNVIIDIINALVTGGQADEDIVVNWKILLPFNWGYANWATYVQH
jgi:hypothetical protein